MINNQWYAVLSSADAKKGKVTGFIDSFIAWLGKWANLVVERQDKRVVETQRPKKSSLRMNENLVMADWPIMEYRRRREELQNL